MQKIEVIENLLKPLITDMGYQFWGMRLFAQGKNSTLQIFIDSAKGISVDDCTEVSLAVSPLLDVEDCINESYNLEVSSPGLNREFFQLKQCQSYLGQKVKIMLFHKVLTKRNFVACIDKIDLDNNKIHLIDENDDEICLDYSMIRRIKLAN